MMAFPSYWSAEQKQRFEFYLPLLGQKQLMTKVPCIHVAGTNGKGSVCAMLESVYRNAGYRTGLFTSPHLYQETERILVNGIAIDQMRMTQEMQKIAEILPESGYFERTFFCAMKVFQEERCEIAIIEAGIGGAMDVTNLIVPLATVIVNVGLDHTAILGDTVEKIAEQKAGIAKKGVPMVLYPELSNQVQETIAQVCDRVQAPIRKTDTIRINKQEELLDSVLWFETDKSKIGPVKLPLLGAYQQNNARVVLGTLMAVENVLRVTPRQIIDGLENTDWPGRMQWIPSCKNEPQILIDGAHNPQAAKMLKENVQQLFGTTNIVLLCAVMKDKNAKGVVEQLNALAQNVVCTVAEPTRGLPAKDLASLFTRKTIIEPEAKRAFQKAKEMAKQQQALLVVAGSLYLPSAIGLLDSNCGR